MTLLKGLLASGLRASSAQQERVRFVFK